MELNQIKEIVTLAHSRFSSIHTGEAASYIPELMRANPDHFAISVTTASGESFSIGEAEVGFTLQSTSKPFIYGLALECYGKEKLMQTTGVEPSGEAFNSIIELEEQSHLPFNPMVNSGAIAITHLLKAQEGQTRLDRVLHLFDRLTQDKTEIDLAVYQSEKKTAHRNQAIAYLLRHFGVVDDLIDESLDLYFKQCSVVSNAKKLSLMAATLANSGIQPHSQERIFSNETVRDMLSIMFTCGMYDSAGKWAYSVGIPSKSGVSGAIFGVVPGQFGVAVYSPRIDQHGHSIRGLRTFEFLSESLKLHIFEPKGTL